MRGIVARIARISAPIVQRTAAVALAAALGVSGCSKGTAPTPVQPTPIVSSHLLVSVLDTLGRGLPGARVDIVDGPFAGTSSSADTDGGVEFIATTSGSVTVRAELDGYQPQTQQLHWLPISDPTTQSVVLKTLKTSASFAYYECSQLPREWIVDQRECSSAHDTIVFTRR